MKEETGKLIQQGKRVMVQLPTKKGTALFPIPEKAKRFRDSDFAESIEALVKRDEQNRIVEITIPGKPVVQAAVTAPKSQKGPRRGKRPGRREAVQPRALKDIGKASPKIIGGPFINPYTFLPFAEKPLGKRCEPTLLSQDEIDDPDKRLTGVIRLKVTTKSPLMTCDTNPVEKRENGHKILQALTIQDDVIVPATGVRGALRTLMTILTSGTLGYVDPTAFLVQGRDTKLGPAPSNQPRSDVPRKVFLARVENTGNANRSGTIELGHTTLVRFSDLQRTLNRDQLDRSPTSRPVWIGLDEEGNPNGKASGKESADTPWRLRLSGRPVGGPRIEERKKEGLYKPNGKTIELPAELWADYLGRNVAGAHSELRKGDLVWLEPTRDWMESGKTEIESNDDIESLQWARWGKIGKKLTERVRPEFHPDSWRQDGDDVDEVTNVFGQVKEHGSKAISFSSRVRPENLVFRDAKSSCQRTVLAPLSMPHPGCIAFYRDNENPDEVGEADMLRGYKVYRASSETGDEGPWNFDVQGVYDGGKLKPAEQPVNQTVDLLPPDTSGTLNITYRGLCHRELALLIQACEVPWRLGGGKPLGLGACVVEIETIIDEFGNKRSAADLLGVDWKERRVKDIQERVAMWEASQRPVAMMRYPRAVKQNARGGHAWFSLHAQTRKVGRDGKRVNGLEAISISEPLSDNAVAAGEPIDAVDPMISGQVLPKFDKDNCENDVLYGYDMVPLTEHGRKNVVQDFEPLAEDLSNMGDYDRHKNRADNANKRKKRKADRRS